MEREEGKEGKGREGRGCKRVKIQGGGAGERMRVIRWRRRESWVIGLMSQLRHTDVERERQKQPNY